MCRWASVVGSFQLLFLSLKGVFLYRIAGWAEGAKVPFSPTCVCEISARWIPTVSKRTACGEGWVQWPAQRLRFQLYLLYFLLPNPSLSQCQAHSMGTSVNWIMVHTTQREAINHPNTARQVILAWGAMRHSRLATLREESPSMASSVTLPGSEVQLKSITDFWTESATHIMQGYPLINKTFLLFRFSHKMVDFYLTGLAGSHTQPWDNCCDQEGWHAWAD